MAWHGNTALPLPPSHSPLPVVVSSVRNEHLTVPSRNYLVVSVLRCFVSADRAHQQVRRDIAAVRHAAPRHGEVGQQPFACTWGEFKYRFPVSVISIYFESQRRNMLPCVFGLCCFMTDARVSWSWCSYSTTTCGHVCHEYTSSAFVTQLWLWFTWRLLSCEDLFCCVSYSEFFCAVSDRGRGGGVLICCLP